MIVNDLNPCKSAPGNYTIVDLFSVPNDVWNGLKQLNMHENITKLCHKSKALSEDLKLWIVLVYPVILIWGSGNTIIDTIESSGLLLTSI